MHRKRKVVEKQDDPAAPFEPVRYGKRGRKQLIPDEEIVALFESGKVSSAQELYDYLTSLGLNYSNTSDGMYKLIRRVEKRTGKQLIPEYEKRGRPQYLTDEELEILKQVITRFGEKQGSNPTTKQLVKFVADKFGKKYSVIGLYMHLQRRNALPSTLTGIRRQRRNEKEEKSTPAARTRA